MGSAISPTSRSRHNDLPVTQAIVTLLSFVYVGLTLAADLVNAWLDPRMRVERAR